MDQKAGIAASEGGLGHVRLRFWASARAAAGVAEHGLATTSPVAVRDVPGLVALALERPDLARVLSICSVLVDERPAGVASTSEVLLGGGEQVEFLPPFAGG